MPPREPSPARSSDAADAADAAETADAADVAETADEIMRGTADGGAARVVAVTATGVALEAIRRHEARGASAVALARGLTAGLLLATLTKDEERVTLQLLGDGPLGGVTVDAAGAGTARAYVKDVAAGEAEPADRPRLAAALGTNGLVSVVRDLGLRETFRGQTDLATGEIDEDTEHYLSTSEQIESALRCETVLAPDGTLAAAAGVLVQALPGGRGVALVEAARARLHAGALRAALVAEGPHDPGSLIENALGEVLGTWHALDERPVRFFCSCSHERAGASLALLGVSDLADMILEDGKAEVVCNFCRARYEFTEADLERIRRELRGPADPPS